VGFAVAHGLVMTVSVIEVTGLCQPLRGALRQGKIAAAIGTGVEHCCIRRKSAHCAPPLKVWPFHYSLNQGNVNPDQRSQPAVPQTPLQMTW